MLATIVGNILAQPNEPKYRRINVSKQQYQYAIGRPYGGPVIMQKLGFVQDKDDASTLNRAVRW